MATFKAILWPTLASILVASAGSARQFQLPPGFSTDYLFGKVSETVVGAGSDLLKQSVWYAGGTKEFTVRRADRESVADAFVETVHDYSTSYTIADITVRPGGMQIFIAGVKANGESIIERWTWSEQALAGRIGVSPPPPPPIGTNQSPFVLSAVAFGPWQLPQQRFPPPTRRTIYEGPLGPFMEICVDPEGRYILLHAPSGSAIYRIDTAGPQISTPYVLFSATDAAQFSLSGRFSVFDYQGEGRLIVFNTPIDGDLDSMKRVHLRDTDNDAVIDNLVVFPTFDNFLSSPYGQDKSKWTYLWQLQ